MIDLSSQIKAKRAELATLEMQLNEADAHSQRLNQEKARLDEAIPAHNARVQQLLRQQLKAQGVLEFLEDQAAAIPIEDE